jgi:hypothetical protein
MYRSTAEISAASGHLTREMPLLEKAITLFTATIGAVVTFRNLSTTSHS